MGGYPAIFGRIGGNLWADTKAKKREKNRMNKGFFDLSKKAVSTVGIEGTV